MINKILTLSIILLFFGLFYVVYYYREPFGDDILIFYNHGISYYLDKMTFDLGGRTTSFAQVIPQVVYAYNAWTGRIIGYVIMLSCGLLSLGARSLITASWFSIAAILCVSLIYGDWKKALQKPLSFLAIYIILFWYNNATGLTLMWTFSSIYITALIFCFLYLYYFEKISQRNFKLRKNEIIILNIIGLFAGMTHEIIAAIVLGMVLYKTISCILRKIIDYRMLFIHTGFLLGYLICFSAPGNFNRLQQSHEDAIRSISLIGRIYSSINAHIISLQPSNYFGRLFILTILLLFICTFIVSLMKKGLLTTSKEFLQKNDMYLVGAFLSVLLWGVVAAVPAYGPPMWVGLILIILLKNISLPEKFKNEMVNLGLSFLIIIVIIILNFPWIKSFADITTQRRDLIKTAVANKMTEVIVPKYPEMTDNNMTHAGYQNDQNQFDLEYYIDYYRIHIIIGD